MSVGYIAAAKEQVPVTPQPLVLVELTLTDSVSNPTMIYLTTDLFPAGVTYGGITYQPILLDGDSLVSQLLADEGIDQPPSAQIKISDANNNFWGAYELPIGLKGATAVFRFVMYNVGLNDFSTDSVVRFRGVCGKPGRDEGTVTIPVGSRSALSQTMLPTCHIQPTCIWSFPVTVKQRQSSSVNDYDPSYECGYAPDAAVNTVGNWQYVCALAATISSTSATTISVTGGAAPVPLPFPITINGGPTSETLIVTAMSGGNWTVQRGMQGTIAQTASAGNGVYVPFTTCNLTRQNCMQRLGNSSNTTHSADGDITHDQSGRASGRFSGSQWNPPTDVISRGYIDGKWDLIVNNSNYAKYGDLIPFCYGEQTWVQPKVLATTGDANYTKFEVMLCYGQVPYIYDVIVGGERIPHVYNDTLLSNVPGELAGGAGHPNISAGFWQTVNDGRRNGSVNLDKLYDGKGDCYGSIATIEIVVPVRIQNATSVPNVQVRLDGPAIRVYTTPTTFTRQHSANPVWILMDLMFWSGYTPGDINIQSAINAAAYYDTQIYHTDITNVSSNTLPNPRTGGGTTPYALMGFSYTVQSRRSAAEIIRSLRAAAGLIVAPNFNDGKLYFLAQQTLASQQPSPVQLNGQNASNNNTGIAGYLTDGVTSGTGYSAYDFDESCIANVDETDGSASTFQWLAEPLTQTPNVYTVGFTNIENRGSVDSLTIGEPEDVDRTNQEIPGTLNIDGPNTFDRVQRAGTRQLALNMRCNTRQSANGQVIGDTGGSFRFQFETSFRAIHLVSGHICRIKYSKEGITTWWPFRVESVSAGSNAKRLTIIGRYHNDIHFFSTFGQTGAPLFTSNYLSKPKANIWHPNQVAPPAGDALFSYSEAAMGVTQSYPAAADGSAIAQITVAGQAPENTYPSSPKPPYISEQSTTANTGGTVPGDQTYFIQICAKTATGTSYSLSGPSPLSTCAVPAGTNTNTISIPTPLWDPLAWGYVIFAGRKANALTYQGVVDFSTQGAGPSSITMSAYFEDSWGIPDSSYDHLALRTKRVLVPGVWVAPIASLTSTTITVAVPGAGFTTNQWAGYVLSVVATSGGSTPVANFKIASNTSTTLTFAGGAPDAVAIGLNAGDMVCLRAAFTVGSDATGIYITDPNFNNILNPLEATFQVSNCTVATGVITVTTLGAHGYSTGDQVLTQGIGGVTNANGTNIITVTGSTTFTLNSVVGSGSYTTGGTVARQDVGISANIAGAIVRWFAGTGRGMISRVAANTSNKIYVDSLPTTPDATSMAWIEEAAWAVQIETAPATNSMPRSPVSATLEVSNYDGQVMVVQGSAANKSGNAPDDQLSPVRDIYLYGKAAFSLDTAPPSPEATYTITAPGAGQLVLAGITWAAPTTSNLATINSGTLQLFYYPDSSGTPTNHITVALTATSGTTAITASAALAVGSIIAINNEIMIVQSWSGLSGTVFRGLFFTTVAAHSSSALIYVLTQGVYTMPFPLGFFLSSTSGWQSFQYPVTLSSVKLYASQLNFTNSRGEDPVGLSYFYLSGGNLGLETGSAGLVIPDTAVPTPEANFTITTPGAGQVVLSGISWTSPSTSNIVTLSSGTLQVFYYLDASGVPTNTITANMATASVGAITAISAAVALSVGDIIVIDHEIMVIISWSGLSGTAFRGLFNSTPGAHSIGALIYKLSNQVFTIPFPENFFLVGNAWQTFTYSMQIPNAQVCAAQLNFTNALGEDPTGLGKSYV
jgi:Ubiquitin-activating enzyme E1 FCCH domain